MSNLKPGDVLVFKAGDDWVGKAIAWLTESDVSHAAMMMDGNRMVEMGPSGISASPVEAQDGSDAILLRMTPEKDAAPLVTAAQRYIDDTTRYDFPALACLAGLIIYRKIRPTPKLVAITDTILRAACVALDKMIDAAMKKPGHHMVCSQLVYQVYEDCGKEYRIHIDNGLLQKTNDLAMADGYVYLADLAAEASNIDRLSTSNIDFPSDEELARDLLVALESSRDMDLSGVSLGALPSWAKRFIEKLEELLEKSQSSIPLNSMFVTPADLAYKTKNLTVLGKLDIVRKTS
jgi:hypothetical protein